ncbi:MAG: hypothetical protein IGS03_08120 [Candidatus Sericytochromatia bacterium]|nr:hypothetical protein [Candidatus Sericytochromatia bacterium]
MHKPIIMALVLGFSLALSLGAYSQSQTDREIERLRSELNESNRHLSQISRSLDTMSRAFSNGELRVRK